MITAKKIDEEVYPDIKMGREYEVEDVREYIFIKGNKRHYRPIHFNLFKDGKKITVESARCYVILERN